MMPHEPLGLSFPGITEFLLILFFAFLLGAIALTTWMIRKKKAPQTPKDQALSGDSRPPLR